LQRKSFSNYADIPLSNGGCFAVFRERDREGERESEREIVRKREIYIYRKMERWRGSMEKERAHTVYHMYTCVCMRGAGVVPRYDRIDSVS